MAVAVHVPRINNNDDVVRLVRLDAAVGKRVERGAILGQVETDKAIVDIEAPGDGFVIALLAVVDDSVDVGSILLWLGERIDEPVPQPAPGTAAAPAGSAARAGNAPTAKALLMLQRHGLAAGEVPCSGDRLTTEDVERFVASRSRAATITPMRAVEERLPEVAGELRELRSDERGMIHTVSWSRDFSVPGYLELEYDPGTWDVYAKAYADQHRLLLSPLLALMAWRLVQLAHEMPMLNATIVGERRYEFAPVNLGFTVQVGQTLYLTVVRDAVKLGEAPFVTALGDIQRRASGHKLAPDEIRGATIAFSSMARWKVSRHIPVLPPQTAIIIAHAASLTGAAVLGASYDHRVLNGFQVVDTLRKLSTPGGPATGIEA